MTIEVHGRLGGRRYTLVQPEVSASARAIACVECGTAFPHRDDFLQHACETVAEAAEQRVESQARRGRRSRDTAEEA